MEIQVIPKYLVPDTNCLIEDLDGLKTLVSWNGDSKSPFSVVVPNLGNEQILPIENRF